MASTQIRLIDYLANREETTNMVAVMKLFWHEVVSLDCFPGTHIPERFLYQIQESDAVWKVIRYCVNQALRRVLTIVRAEVAKIP